MVEGESWRALSDSLTLKRKAIPSIRGNIYSADGNLLATSIPKYKLSVDMTVIPNDSFRRYVSELSFLMASEFGQKSADEYLQMFKRGKARKNRYLTIARNANYIQLRKMQTWPIFRMGRYKGGLIEEERTERKLPLGSLAGRTIGFKNENISGVGLEATYDAILSGESGFRLYQKISGGYKPVNDKNETEPENGRDIYTTLDVNIQDIAHASLERGMQTHQASHGCAIVMEVGTGKIKAIANLSQNPDGSYSERYNYAIGGNFEPGSTFKLVSALALLEDKHNEPGDSVEINYGSHRFYDRIMKDSEKSPHKSLTFQESIEKSSNVGVSRLIFEAYKSHPKDFLAHIHRLQLTDKAGTGLKGEAIPKLPTPGQRGWSGTTLPWISIGYALEVTPLHILMFYNAIANEGKMMKPMLVSGIGSLGKIKEVYEPEVKVEKICGDETLKKLKSMLRGVVEKGTATNLNKMGIQLAGKTGTAQIAQGSEGYGHDRYHASFAGYFPADKPMYSCIVVVSEPKSGVYYGSAVAAPVFAEIARKVYAKGAGLVVSRTDTMVLPEKMAGHYDDIKTILTQLELPYTVMGASGKTWVRGGGGSKQVILVQEELETSGMPDFRGMGLRDALFIAENRKLRVRTRGYGKVVSQQPQPGQIIKRGDVIQLNMQFQ